MRLSEMVLLLPHYVNEVSMYRLLLLVTVFSLLSGCAYREAALKEAAYHYQMGLSFLGENNPTGALIELTQAEKITPDDPELLNYLGMAYFRKNRFDLAEQKYQRAVRLKPSYSEARNNLAVNYMEMKRWDDAIAQLKQVTEDLFYKDQVSATINLGIAFYGKGDYQQSLSILRTVVGENPRDPRAHFHLGKVYMGLDKVEIAVGEFKRATELFRDYTIAYYNLGLAYLKNNAVADARNAFREVLRIAPESEIGQLAREQLDTLK